MPYIINKYSGPQITTVSDGTIDATLDIKLIGKNYAGYGEVQNENLVFMLENFANTAPPPRPMKGQIWFDTGAGGKLKFFDGNRWRTTGGAEIGENAPTTATIGDFWFNTTTKQLFAWDGSQQILIGPEGVPGAGVTQMKSRSITDVNAQAHTIIEAIVNNSVICVISPDDMFELPLVGANSITGFKNIHKGITLAYTNDDVSNIGRTTADHRFWGTASDADRLGGYAASTYLRENSATFVDRAYFADSGFEVGVTRRLRVYNNNTDPTIINQVNDTLVFQTTSGSIKTPLKFVGADSEPGADNLSNFGNSGKRFKEMFAYSFNGLATSSTNMRIGSTDYPAKVDTAGAGTALSIAARDSNGYLNAVRFQGTATQAYYADLAENYLADADYAPGTVVMIGGEKEVTASAWGKRAIGAVSTDPAYLMNSGLEGGTPIALKGRVPVKVVGRIKKGDELIAADNGCAVMALPHSNGVFAVALESSDDEGIKLVECLIL